MAVNTSKVLVGGIAAGVVLNVIDWLVYTKLLAARLAAAADAFHPGLSAVMNSRNAITIYVITDLVFGILLVWTYAAVRPRFGPGPKTAFTVAILFWIITALVSAGNMINGMLSASLFWTAAICGLVNFLIAAWVGAMIYTEDSAPAA